MNLFSFIQTPESKFAINCDNLGEMYKDERQSNSATDSNLDVESLFNGD